MIFIEVCFLLIQSAACRQWLWDAAAPCLPSQNDPGSVSDLSGGQAGAGITGVLGSPGSLGGAFKTL